MIAEPEHRRAHASGGADRHVSLRENGSRFKRLDHVPADNEQGREKQRRTTLNRPREPLAELGTTDGAQVAV